MTELCSLFGVTKQAYYQYDGHYLQTLLLREQVATDYVERIRAIDPCIGCKKLHIMYAKEFRTEHPLGRDHFLRLMEQRGLKLRRRHSQVPRTTDSRHTMPTYPNRIWNVIPLRPNRIWVSDITYIKVRDNMEQGQYHFCYLSLVSDAYSKMVVGYAAGDSLDTVHPLSALQMAFSTLPPDFDYSGLTHHSDRGVQYASHQYVQALSAKGITISMTESGNPKDNAVAERINNTIKNEFFARLQFTSLDQIQQEVAKAVSFYNMCRPHWSLNGMTPSEAASQEGEIPKSWHSYREKAIKESAT